MIHIHRKVCKCTADVNNNALRVTGWSDSQKSYPTGLVDLEKVDIKLTTNTQSAVIYP